MIRAYSHRIWTMTTLFLLAAAPQFGAGVRYLTLQEAVRLALSQNRALKIARLKVIENEQKKAGEHAGYFPMLTNESHLLHITELENVEIPAGAFGTVAGLPIPLQSILLPQGKLTFYSSGTQLSQPLTQLIRTRDLNRIAAAEVAVSRDDLKKVENQVALQVHTLYFGILIARLQKQAAEQQSGYAEEALRESENEVRDGSALQVVTIQSRATLLESRQAVLTAELQVADLTAELNDLLGLPLDTRLELSAVAPANFDQRPLEQYVQTAWSENPEILTAEEEVRKAGASVAEARTAYIPDITAYARHSYQVGVPFLARNFGTFGLNLNWDVFEFGRRRATVRVREAELAQAQENLKRLKDDVAVAVQRSYDRLQRTRDLVQVASEVVKLRQENERLAQNELAQGVVLASEPRQAIAASYQAQAEFLQASLGYLLAWAELQQAVGRTPGIQ